MSKILLYDNEIIKNMTKYNYYMYCKLKYQKCSYELSDLELQVLRQQYDLLPYDEKIQYDRYIYNLRRRKWRMRLRIDYMLNNFDCSFVTFTLSNEHINKDLAYIRKIICSVLKKMNCYYIGNIDFGKETERLHFHFIVAKQDKIYLKNNYMLGFVDVKNITNKNSYRLSNYIDKLVNHSLKESTMTIKKANIITSRGLYSFTDILEKRKD